MGFILRYIKQLKLINPKGSGYYNFLLSKGDKYSSDDILKNGKLAEEYCIRIISKACFYNAQQLAVFSKGEFEYCEGYAISKNLGIPIEHAWNVKDGKIIDISWKNGIEYFGVRIPYEWIKKKFYEYAFKHNISDAHLLRYYKENANKNS